MGVEGKERQRELETGAQVLSGNMGKTIQRLRKAYNLSLSELAEQSGVAKSIISQIERNETNPDARDHLAPEPGPGRIHRAGSRFSRRGALHREILEGRHAHPRLRGWQNAPCHRRLAQDHRMAAMV
jgi:hypothetical protein